MEFQYIKKGDIKNVKKNQRINKKLSSRKKVQKDIEK